MISKSKKALIHVAKGQIGMSEDEYRSMLEGFGVSSSADPNMTDRTFNQVMSRFKELGFKSKSQTRRRNVKNLPASKRELMRKLEAIILDMNLSWAYVDGIAKKRFQVDKAQWLDPEPLRKLLQMMIIHQKRTQRKR
jgi:phage gp16-like protein